MIQVTQAVQFMLPFIMVFVTIFIAWQFAAGLALYRLTSLLLNLIQQYFVTGWGSLLTFPRVAGISSSGSNSHAQVQQVQPGSASSSSKGHVHGKAASARRRGKSSKKNRR